MPLKNTRRGHTQETVNKKGHSHLFLSRMNPLYNNNLTTRGFTLVELLVVVLIIAVLAAVALPQYNKAVKRAQGREVYAAIDALDKALETYYLENGTYTMQVGCPEHPGWFSREPVNQEGLNIDIPTLKHFWFKKYVGTGSTDDSHSFAGISGYLGNPDTVYYVSIYNPDTGIQVGTQTSISVSLFWERGRLKDISCQPAELCALYFEGTVQFNGSSYNFIWNR